MRTGAFNSHVDPVKTEMTGTQQIPILQVCDSDESKSKGIITDKNLSQVCSTDKSESEIVIINESSTDDSESEIVQKSINTTDETYHEETLVTDNPVINDPRYFNFIQVW